MITDAFDAFADIFSPPFRRVMWKSLGLTTAILVLAGVGLDRLALSFVHVGPAWLGVILSVVLALGLIVGMIGGFAAFALGCSVGVLANIDVASWMYRSSRTWWAAGLSGAVLSVVWNYAVSTNLIWRPRRRGSMRRG